MAKYRKLNDKEYDAYQKALDAVYDNMPFMWNYFVNIVPITVNNTHSILIEQHFFIDPFGRMCVPFTTKGNDLTCEISAPLLFHHVLHFLNKTHFFVEEDVVDTTKVSYDPQIYVDGHCLCINSVLRQTVQHINKPNLTIPANAFTPYAMKFAEDLSTEEYITLLLDSPSLPPPGVDNFSLRCVYALLNPDEMRNIDDAMPRMNRNDAHDMRQNLKLDMLEFLRNDNDNNDTDLDVSSEGSSADKIILNYLQGKKPKISWQDILRGKISRRKNDSLTNARSDWSKSRRYNPTNFILPGVSGVSCDVLIGVDVSYSMQGYLPHVFTEVAAILEEQQVPTKFFSVDTEVANISVVESLKDINIYGGGGTDMRVAYNYAATVDCEMFILFTDGETPYPTINPCQCEVVTCIVHLRNTISDYMKPSFGTVIEVEITP